MLNYFDRMVYISENPKDQNNYYIDIYETHDPIISRFVDEKMDLMPLPESVELNQVLALIKEDLRA